MKILRTAVSLEFNFTGSYKRKECSRIIENYSFDNNMKNNNNNVVALLPLNKLMLFISSNYPQIIPVNINNWFSLILSK